jgi:23S rRNA maturation mini-RNase III
MLTHELAKIGGGLNGVVLVHLGSAVFSTRLRSRLLHLETNRVSMSSGSFGDSP